MTLSTSGLSNPPTSITMSKAIVNKPPRKNNSSTNWLKNTPPYSLLTCRKGYPRIAGSPTTSSSSLMHNRTANSLTALLKLSYRNSKNTLTTFWNATSFDQAVAHGAPPSSSPRRRMEAYAFVWIIAPLTKSQSRIPQHHHASTLA